MSKGTMKFSDHYERELEIRKEGNEVLLKIDHKHAFQQILLTPEQAKVAATALTEVAKTIK